MDDISQLSNKFGLNILKDLDNPCLIQKIEFVITGIENDFDNFSDLPMLILLTKDEVHEIEFRIRKTFSELD